MEREITGYFNFWVDCSFIQWGLQKKKTCLKISVSKKKEKKKLTITTGKYHLGNTLQLKHVSSTVDVQYEVNQIYITDLYNCKPTMDLHI